MLYKDSGVDISHGDSFAEFIKSRAFKRNVLYPDFALALDFDKYIKDIENPYLVYSTDGIGTKIELAIQYNDVSGLGKDLVAMCVNDILVLGAKPIVFLDYIATDSVKNQYIKPFMAGLLNVLKEEGIELGGGETAELSDLISRGMFDVGGFVIGIVSGKKLLKKDRVKENDVILGVASSGVHSNGFSLVRAVLKEKSINADKVFIGNKKLIDLLLAPTEIYTKILLPFFEKGIVHGAAHITGGGIAGNLKRTLPDSVDAVIFKDKIKVHPVFEYLQKEGDIPENEMWRVFNMGVGFIVITSHKDAEKIKNIGAYEIGRIIQGSGKVILK